MPATRTLVALLLTGVCLAAGCATDPGQQRLRHHDDYFVRSPGTHRFRYERALDGGSWIRGELVVEIDKVVWNDGPQDAFRFSGRIANTLRGHFTTRRAAQEAPRQAVRDAMAPDNIPEVFEVVKKTRGVEVTRIHWDRLGTLRLPIDVDEQRPAAPFSSALTRQARDWAIEVALVWHKALLPFLEVMPFGTYTATSVVETDDAVTIHLRQDLGAGEPLRYEYRFARGRSLTGLVAHLRDGTTLRVTATAPR